jgi:hypothetical protein
VTARRIFKLRYERMLDVVENPEPKNLLDLPLALRQMLVDGNSLVHQANREHRLKLAFTVGRSLRQEHKEMAALGLPMPDTHLLARFPPNEPKIDISLDQLLAFDAVKLDGNFYSFHELLDACANKLGGVHFDPNGEKHKVVRDIQKLGEFLESQGIGSAFSVLLLLARTSLLGLRPLYEAISDK